MISLWGGAVAISMSMTPAAGSAGCLVCDQASCESSISLSIREPGQLTPLAVGKWTFTFVLDDAEPLITTCEIGSGSLSAACDHEELVSVLPSSSVEASPYFLFIAQFEGDGAEHPAEELRIRIERNGTTLHDELHELSYSDGGSKRCPSDCEYISLDIRVDER